MVGICGDTNGGGRVCTDGSLLQVRLAIKLKQERNPAKHLLVFQEKEFHQWKVRHTPETIDKIGECIGGNGDTRRLYLHQQTGDGENDRGGVATAI